MNHGEFTAVLIVAIVMFASIIRARFGYGRRRYRDGPTITPQEQAETLKAKDAAIHSLESRLADLEKLVARLGQHSSPSGQ